VRRTQTGILGTTVFTFPGEGKIPEVRYDCEEDPKETEKRGYRCMILFKLKAVS